MEYEIKLPAFEGPFDLLLHLIRENQVDIYDIPIAEISRQYLDYLQAMEELDLEIASEFLVMAATLLAIKARMLLPASPMTEDDEPEDARAPLVHDLLEYMRFKEAAGAMTTLREISRRELTRPNEQELYVNLFSEENPLSGKTLADLQSAFCAVLKKVDNIDSVLSIERETVTMSEKLDELFRLIVGQPEGLAFSTVFASCYSRIELIVTFLALLELIRQRVIKVEQSGEFKEIYLYVGDLNNYDRNATF